LKLAANDKRGLKKRNEDLLREKEIRSTREIPSDMEHCTFKPNILKREDIIARFQEYKDHYTKRSEDYKKEVFA